MQNKVFELFDFHLDFHVIEGHRVSRTVIFEVYFKIIQLLYVDEFEGLPPNVVNRTIICVVVLIFILNAKNPYLSEVDEVVPIIMILLLHFDTFRVVLERKADLANSGSFLIFTRIDNEILENWVIFDIAIFLVDDEIDVWFNFPYFINVFVCCAYTFA